MNDNEPEAVAEFREAVRDDEYAELELETGDTLITDWEGDGTFLPYVVPRTDPEREDPEIDVENVGVAVADALDVRVRYVAWDFTNGVYDIDMERPETPEKSLEQRAFEDLDTIRALAHHGLTEGGRTEEQALSAVAAIAEQWEDPDQ